MAVIDFTFLSKNSLFFLFFFFFETPSASPPGWFSDKSVNSVVLSTSPDHQQTSVVPLWKLSGAGMLCEESWAGKGCTASTAFRKAPHFKNLLRGRQTRVLVTLLLHLGVMRSEESGGQSRSQCLQRLQSGSGRSRPCSGSFLVCVATLTKHL